MTGKIIMKFPMKSDCWGTHSLTLVILSGEGSLGESPCSLHFDPAITHTQWYDDVVVGLTVGEGVGAVGHGGLLSLPHSLHVIHYTLELSGGTENNGLA